MNWIKKNGTTLLLVLIFAVGAGLIAYPTFSDWWNSFHQSRAVASYAEAVANMNTEEYERSIREAQEYNQEISKTGIRSGPGNGTSAKLSSSARRLTRPPGSLSVRRQERFQRSPPGSRTAFSPGIQPRGPPTCRPKSSGTRIIASSSSSTVSQAATLPGSDRNPASPDYRKKEPAA